MLKGGRRDVRVTGLSLALADGQRWVIRAADEEAGECLSWLGQVMRLRRGEQGHEVLVSVGRLSSDQAWAISNGGPLLCCLPRRLDPLLGVIQMQQVAGVIAQVGVKRGDLLIHGALAEHDGRGFILAGPGGVGKSTASSRLPEPWHALSDDATLVVRDRSGRYWAHPWPTWSRFHYDGPGGSWPVEQAVPLEAILFLKRAPSDRLEPVTSTHSAALIFELALVFAMTRERRLELNARRAMCETYTQAARALAASVPAYTLCVSRTGQFWNEIEKALPSARAGPQYAAAPTGAGADGQRAEADPGGFLPPDARTVSRSTEVVTRDGRLYVVYIGPSMNPTLREPDLLEVEPYGARQVQAGDVVCFKAPNRDGNVVHRVIRVTSAGVGTKGDANPGADPWVLPASQLMGRVMVARRGSRHRRVAGGWQGLVVARAVRLSRRVWRLVGWPFHRFYEYLVRHGPFDYLLPRSLRPRLVRYDARHNVVLRLVAARRVIGSYDDIHGRWKIKRPFRLLVDEELLERPPAPEWQRGQLAGSDPQSSAPNPES